MELFNKCLHLGTFPDPLKLGNIILFKKEGKPEDEASSYRPISPLPTIGKVLEKLLTQRLNYHLERLNKISDNQYGFREGRSTELAIHHLIQKINEGKKKNPHVLKHATHTTTATSALQVILRLPPLYLQLQQEARVTAIRRLNISLPDTLTTLVPGEVEKGETGWVAHPAECPTEKQISLVDGGNITSGTRIYTDGSKTEKGVGTAFCVWSEQNIVYRWLAKLQDYNTVFQAELLALKHATDHATSLPHQSITNLVDNQAKIQAAANPRSRNTTAREICKGLITNKHIHIFWIKAHVSYDRNEEPNRLAKEAAESDRDPLSVKAPISFLKSIFKK
ncbi:hypothetical protein AVEN_22288-1 [Araneus ventricosus]|uniref:RNase H type-1 domain-containing protein n=1 Tax=Araneus ventricosus TaxID=182803 RepID=A0A4Y2TLY1_ARAVE|nr:hypothetical protein AVEN_22288-1 [Araneus ventricosus]